MIWRVGIIGGFLAVTMGTWLLIRPPATQIDRLANGALVTASAEVVTRSSPNDPILPDPGLIPRDVQIMDDTFAAVLDGLGFGASELGLRDVTSGALSGIGAITGEVSEPQVPALADMLIDGLRARDDDATIHAALTSALSEGVIEVPGALITTHGDIDTALLLETVVIRAKARIGTDELPAPADFRTYTVVSGDSLARIASEAYGDPTAFPLLLEANDDLMSHPAQISTGMRLLVPPL